MSDKPDGCGFDISVGALAIALTAFIWLWWVPAMLAAFAAGLQAFK